MSKLMMLGLGLLLLAPEWLSQLWVGAAVLALVILGTGATELLRRRLRGGS